MGITMQHEPHVGIFWLVPDDPHSPRLVTDMTRLSLAEPYGQVLTHPRGHYEVWSKWQKLGVTGLLRRGLPRAIYEYEYEELPRGRVVFMPELKVFTIYHGGNFGNISVKIPVEFNIKLQSIHIKLDIHYFK